MSANHSPAPPPEPSSPLWLPALGVALFTLAGVYWLLQPSKKVVAPETGAATVTQEAGAPAQPGHEDHDHE